MATNNHKKITIDISLKSYLLAVLVFLSILFFRHIADLALLLFISFLISVAIGPLVDFLQNRNIPRSVSSFFILLLIFSSLVTLAVSLISPLILETRHFLQQQLPLLVERLAPYNIDLSSFLVPKINSAPENVLKLAVDTFSGVITLFTLVVISYYLIQDRPNLTKYLTSWLGSERGHAYTKAVTELEKGLGSWIRGQLFLMVLVGSLNYFGFLLIGLPFAIPLAVIAGVLELVPNMGPTMAAVPAILVGFSISPTHGFFTAGLAIVVQQLENNIFVPKIMGHAVGLHPIAVILALSIGFSLGGPILAILSLPLVLSARVITSHLHHRQVEEIKEEIIT